MDIQILVEAGLTEAQAKAYAFLVECSPSAPPELAEHIGESRTNAYKILEQLEEIGLAQLDESGKKIKYWAKNPTALLQNIEEERRETELRAKKIENQFPELLNTYLKYNEQPGVRYFQGNQGLIDVFEDQIKTGKDVFFIRTLADAIDIDEETMHLIRNKYVDKKIKRHGITQDHTPRFPVSKSDQIPIDESDQLMLLHRTWIKENDYTAPVEWAAYGDKLSIISFGEEVIAIVIDSPQIAEAFKQIYKLLARSVPQMEGYDTLPKKTTYTRLPESLKRKIKSI